MNWDELSAISQLISSVAVVFSVLYLAIQVHQSTRIAKLSAQDAAATALREVTKPFAENADLSDAVHIAVNALKAGAGNGGDEDTLSVSSLEVAILDATRPRRAFRRITGAALERLLPERNGSESSDDSPEESSK